MFRGELFRKNDFEFNWLWKSYSLLGLNLYNKATGLLNLLFAGIRAYLESS